jgi:hypothetical protein
MTVVEFSDDVIFGITNTKDGDGVFTRLFHIDAEDLGFNVPLSDKNFKYLRKLFNSLEIEEYES